MRVIPPSRIPPLAKGFYTQILFALTQLQDVGMELARVETMLELAISVKTTWRRLGGPGFS